MDVHPAPERLLHPRVIRNVREHAQLDLAVIRVDKDAAVRRDKHPADLAAKLRPHGDILQIRLRRREPPRRRHHVLERRVDAPVVRDLLHKAVGIRRFQLGQHPVVQNGLHDRMLVFQLFEHLRVRGIAAFRLLHRRQSQLFKQQLPELLRRVDVELPARIAENQLLTGRDPLREHIAERDQRQLVDEHARRLHPRQHRAERQLHVIIQLLHPLRFQLRGQHRIERRDRRRPREQIRRNRRLAQFLFVREADLTAAVLHEHPVDRIASLRRIEQIARQRCVKAEALDGQILPQQEPHRLLDVVRHLPDVPRAESAQERLISLAKHLPGKKPCGISVIHDRHGRMIGRKQQKYPFFFCKLP